MVAGKCVNITGYESFKVESNYDHLYIIDSSGAWLGFTGNEGPIPFGHTNPIIGYKSQNLIKLKFYRFI